MQVMIVTPDTVGPVKNGGIGTACFHYARTLANADVVVSILFTGSIDAESRVRWTTFYQNLKIIFLTLDDLPSNSVAVDGGRWHTERSLQIFNYLKNGSFDYILFQDWHANGFWSTRAKRLGVAFLDTTLGIITHSPHEWQKAGMETFGDNPLEEAALEWEEKESIANADVVVSPSRHMIDWLKSNGYALPKQIEICPYTFEDDVRPRNKHSVDRDHLIFFGRLETRKGIHLLASALRAMKAAGQHLPKRVSLLGKHAMITGEPSQGYLQRLIQDLPEIVFVVQTDFDYTTAIDYIKTNSGVVVIPSLLDNFPLTVVESIANSFAFIASTAGGIPEMVDSRVVFEPTARALLDKIINLPGIDFGDLSHKYLPAAARDTWISHVSTVGASNIEAPSIKARSSDAVSVCIPFYKFDRFLPRLMTGFFREQVADLQLVVVNDGTPESECENFLRLKSKLEPIGHIFHTQENKGASAARNKAVELAKHDRIIFFDADNMPLPSMVTKLVDAINASDADSVAAPFVSVPAFLRNPLPEDVWWSYIPSGGPLADSMLDNRLGDTCGIQKKATFERLGGFSTKVNYYDDWEYFFRLVGNGFYHTVYPEPLFYYAFDFNGRRTLETEYRKRINLWGNLPAISSDHLAEVLKVFVRDAYAKRAG